MEREKYLKKLKDKMAKGEKLSFWDKKIIALQKSYEDNYSSESWVNEKIDVILIQRQDYINKKFNSALR